MKKRSKAIVFALATIMLLVNYGASAQNKNTIKSGDCELNLTYKEIIGKPIIMNFNGYPIYEVTIKSDSTLYWESMTDDEKGDEQSKTIILDEYTTMISWVESDSTCISIYSDFKNGKVNGFIITNDYAIYPLVGDILLKTE